MNLEPGDELSNANLGDLPQLLGDPAVWAEPASGIEDRVVAAIAAEQSDQAIAAQGVADTEQVVDLSERRARRVGGRRFWSMAAAALVIIAASSAAGFAFGRFDNTDITTVALAPTELIPEASAIAEVDERPNGARLVLELDGVDPAPAGRFYEVWLVKEEPRTAISAGTFHMRGSDDGQIEFWAGVSTKVYQTITVTLQSETDPSAAGELILRGRIPVS